MINSEESILPPTKKRLLTEKGTPPILPSVFHYDGIIVHERLLNERFSDAI